MSSRAHKLMVLVLILALVTLACSLFTGSQEDGSDDPGVETLQQEKDTQDPTPDTEALPPERGAEVSSDMGGFFFISVPGWIVEEEVGIAAVTSPTADEDVGPRFMLIGGTNSTGYASNDELLQDFTQTDDDVEFSNQRQISIAGVPGLAVDIKGVYEDTEVAGRIVVVMVSADQYFQMIGFAPSNQWEQVGPYFDELLQSVQFFDPADMFSEDLFEDLETPDPDTEPEAVVEPEPDTDNDPDAAAEEIRQWAASAIASSEYSSPDWAASQATGAPDTNECGDLPTAWASFDPDTVEWLELSYDLPVTPTEVNIYQTHTPDQVATVELIDTDGATHEIYTGVPQMTDCPYVLSIQVANAGYQAVGVKITIDQTEISVPWNEIDAVELVGFGESSGPRPPVQPTTAPEGEADAGGDVEVSAWQWSTYSTEDGLSDPEIKAVAVAEDGTVWISHNSTGISSFKDGVFTNYDMEDGLGANATYAVAVGPDGTVWAGTGWGLAYFDDGIWVNYIPKDGLDSGSVFSVAVADDGTVWAGTATSVSSFDGSTFTNYTPDDGLVDTFVYDVAIDDQGHLWFATVGGVSYFDGTTWTSYTEEDGLALDAVYSIAIATDGAVWFGTAGGGVSRFDGGTWTTYTEGEGYDVFYVRDIAVASDGALWFATEGDGVVRFDGQNWLTFRKTDGIPYDWVEGTATAPDGAMWFGFRKEGIASVEH